MQQIERVVLDVRELMRKECEYFDEDSDGDLSDTKMISIDPEVMEEFRELVKKQEFANMT